MKIILGSAQELRRRKTRRWNCGVFLVASVLEENGRFSLFLFSLFDVFFHHCVAQSKSLFESLD